MARHRDELKVFSSYSAPDGDQFGDPSEGVMKTEYGIDGADFPLIGAETRWRIDQEGRSIRHEEKYEYWLCVATEGEGK